MAKCLVVADDLTGANATGVLLKKSGFDTQTLLRAAMDRAGELDECDCLVVPTDSRAVPPEEAYARVRDALARLRGPETLHFSKRVDSTLRGNLGRETDAFLDELGKEYTAVCVPCFPSSGRVLVGSHLLVNGVPLGKTEAAADPICPVHTSNALLLLRGQSQYPVAGVTLDEVHAGEEELGKTLRSAVDAGARTLLVDSVTEEDMQTVAAAVLKAGIRPISVDPGPFTAIMAGLLLPQKPQTGAGKVFCAIGSVNGVAGRQAARLLKKLPVTAEYMDIAAVLESRESCEREIERLVKALRERSNETDILAVIGCGIDPARRVPFEPYMQKRGLDAEGLSGLINAAFAEVSLRLLASHEEFRGVYSTGGDITAAIHSAAGTVGLRLLDEVVPLAGFGIALGGKLAGRAFISKGGMVGDENAMVTCVRYLQQHLQ